MVTEIELFKRLQLYQNDLHEEFFDPADGYFYSTLRRINGVYIDSWDVRRENRTNFIDGEAWVGILLASCFMYPCPANERITRNCVDYLEALDEVNGAVDGRFARTFKQTPDNGWENNGAGYFFRDGQAKAGPMALCFAASRALSCLEPYRPDTSPAALQLLKMYLRFVTAFLEDGMKICDGKKKVTEEGNLNPYSILAVQAPMAYTVCAIGALAADLLGMRETSADINDALLEMQIKSFWSTRPDILSSGWCLAMRGWESFKHLIGDKRGKYSNEHLLYTMLACWMGLGTKQKVGSIATAFPAFQKAINPLHKMTRGWNNPYYLSVYKGLDGELDSLAEATIAESLLSFDSLQPRPASYETKLSKVPVPLNRAKPSAWIWNRDPYEQCNSATTEVSDTVYSPADWVAAYNIAYGTGVLHGAS